MIWLALEAQDNGPPAWPMGDWGMPRRESVESKSGVDGVFEFPGPPDEMPFGSVLIALHPGHSPGGLDLHSGGWPANPEITLKPATPVIVTVMGPDGKPEAGATVHHAVVPARHSEPVRVFERFLSQVSVTGPSGRVELAMFDGEQAFWAEKDDLASIPWQGTNPTTVVLTLGQSFTVGGTVSIPGLAQEGVSRGGERRILVSGMTGNLWRPLARIRDVEEGSWGPLRLPLNGMSRYKVWLEGAPIIPALETFDRPRASSHLRIDFVAKKGVELILDARDESGKPIPTAHAEAWGGPIEFPEVTVAAEALPDGEIRLRTLPSGFVRFLIAAPGYATQELGVAISENARFPITLQKGGAVAGRCIHDEEPIADFQVIYWKAGNMSVFRSRSFLGRRDGRFEIDGLAPGDWWIHAASPAFPAGQPVPVSVTPGAEAQVELELPLAIRGGGRIIAADTEEPIPGAHVQPHSSGGLDRGLPWGPGSISSHDGSFDLDAFVIGTNHITIEAEGFAFAEAEAKAMTADFLDWGDIRMQRPQPLQVSLRGLDLLEGLQAGDLRARTDDGYILPETRFSPDGVVRFEAVPPGDHRLLVVYPDDSWGRLQLRLDPGKDWNFDFSVAGDRKLDVHVVDERGQVRAPITGVYVSAQEETGIFVVRFAWADGGSASFQGIRATRGQLWLLDKEDNIVTTRDASFPDPVNSIEVRIGEKPFRVRIVDSDRAAIPGAWVTIRSPDGVEIRGADDTDIEGWAELGGLPAGALLMDVRHAVTGQRFGVPIDASMSELEFELEASGAIELQLLDGSEPLSGVATRIETTAGYPLGEARQTDDQGRVRYEALGEGAYHLACRRADCWPVVVDEDLSSDEHAKVQVQMRRLADLEFTLFSADGLPVSSMAIELTSTEFEVAVETWIQEERVRAPGGLTTDHRGTIRVEGLPRGAYAWSASLGDLSIEGSFELTPARENRVSGSLPPQ